MGSEWPRVSLSDLGVKLIDCDHKTPKAVDFGVPYIGIPQMDNGRINFDAKPRLISEDDFVTWTRKANPMFGDIILSRRCNSGETVYVPDNTKFALGQNLVLLRPTGDALHPEYLRWAVQGRDWWNEVSRYLNPGAIFESLKCVDIPKFKIPAPPKEQQVKISIILQALTDKIELNRQINQTLEQMAQTLFKSWFVDFDPVIDNALDAIANGQNIEIPESLEKRFEARKAVRESEGFEPLPADIRQLFPCEFEESELGFVPKGWGVSNVGKEFDVVMGQSPPGSTYNEIGNGIPFFQGKTDFGFRFPSNRIYCTEPKRLAAKNDTLISVRAPVGDINLALSDCAIGRGLAAVRHHSKSISFSYYAMNNLSKNFEVFEGEGTVFGSINQKDFKGLPQLNIPTNIVLMFDKFCSDWDLKISLGSGQVDSLTKLRDTLLPKLISGELRLDSPQGEALQQAVSAE